MAIFGQFWTKSLLEDYFNTLKLLLQPVFFVMQSTFPIEKFPRFAVGFRWKDQDASKARIFSWSAPDQGVMGKKSDNSL